MEIAETDFSSGLTRLAVAIADEDGDGNHSSKLAYLDYMSCETHFFVDNSRTYEQGLYSIAVYTDDIDSSLKPYETIYQVGKEQDEDYLLVTKVEDGAVETFAFDFSFVNYSSLDVSDLQVAC